MKECFGKSFLLFRTNLLKDATIFYSGPVNSCFSPLVWEKIDSPKLSNTPIYLPNFLVSY